MAYSRSPMCRRAQVVLYAASLLAVGCGGGGNTEVGDAGVPDAEVPDAAAPIDLSEALFRPDHVLEVSITLDPADWAVLREEPESLAAPKTTCGNQPLDTLYTYFPGDITIETRVGPTCA